jgi:hypothetical protein
MYKCTIFWFLVEVKFRELYTLSSESHGNFGGKYLPHHQDRRAGNQDVAGSKQEPQILVILNNSQLFGDSKVTIILFRDIGNPD